MGVLLLVPCQAVGKAPPLVQELCWAEGLPVAGVHLTKYSVLGAVATQGTIWAACGRGGNHGGMACIVS
jgi:hypothetical protein